MVLVGFLTWRINHVDVHVDRRFQHPKTDNARLLGGFSKCHPGQVGITIGMATRLEPALQLGVKQHQNPPVRRIHHEGRAGQVPRAAAPVQDVRSAAGVRYALDQTEDRIVDGARRAAAPRLERGQVPLSTGAALRHL